MIKYFTSLDVNGAVTDRITWHCREQSHLYSNLSINIRTRDGRPVKILTVIDEYSRECLAIVVERHLQSDDVLNCLTELFVKHGPPEHIRSDNGPEFTAKVVRQWLKRVVVQTLFIEPGSLWENGYNESFNGKLRDEKLNGEIFYTVKEAQGSLSSGGWNTTHSGHTVH
jgi:putative transposase